MPVSSEGFGISVGINTAIAVGCFFFFSILRTHNVSRKFYAPKRYAPGVTVRPKRLKPTFFTWVFDMYTFTEEEMMDIAGLDAVVFLRIFNFGMLFSKDNYVDHLIAEAERKHTTAVYSNIDRLYLTNVKPGSDRLWAHVILAYVFTYIVISLLYKYNAQLSKMRVLYIANQPKGGSSHTALLTDIPGPFLGTVLEALSRLISHGFLRFAPRSFKKKVNDAIESTFGGAADVLGGGKGLTDIMGGMMRMGSSREPTQEGAEIGASGATPGKAAPKFKKRKDARRTEEDIGSFDPWPAAIKHLKDGKTMKELVEDEMKKVYGEEEVLSVNPVYEQAELEPLVADYDKTKQQLEDILDQYISIMKRRKPVKKRFEVSMGCFPKSKGQWAVDKYGNKRFTKIDAIEYLAGHLVDLKAQIQKLQEECRTYITPSSFVTFASREMQVVVATSLHCHDETVWRAQDAPGRNEVIWENLQMRAWERSFRNLVIWGLFALLILTYIPLCALIQAPLNMKQLGKTPVIRDIIAIPFIRGLIEGILPSLVLKIFLAVCPMILAFMNKKAGMVALSQIDFGVVQKYFIFQIFAVFLVQAGVGTLVSNFKQLGKTIGNPGGLINILGTAVPQQATFFMTWILLNGLTANPIGFLRIPGLAIFWILSKLAATDRARMRLWAEQDFTFGAEVTTHVMAIFLGLVFSVQAPIILPIVLYYFIVNTSIYRYQMLYVFSTKFQTGGKMWMVVFHQVMTGLYFFQLVLILVLSLKKFPFVFLIIPIIPVTAMCHIAIVTIFARPWRVISLQAAARLDVLDKEANGGVPLTMEEREQLREDYLSPCFKVNEKEFEELMAEVERVSSRLAEYIDKHEAMHGPVKEHRGTEDGSVIGMGTNDSTPDHSVTTNTTGPPIQLSGRPTAERPLLDAQIPPHAADPANRV